MNASYTILTYNFGNYDIIREPKKKDPDAEYILVTDTQVTSEAWKVVVDPNLAGKNPVYASYYVRYHPFEYASTDTVVTIDASIQLNESIHPIVKGCLPHEYTLMLTNYRTDEDKIKHWNEIRHLMCKEEVDNIYKFIKKFGQENWKGSIGRAFILQRNTKTVNRFNRHVWRYLIALGHDGVPNRQDEVVAHKVLDRYMGKLDLFLVTLQIIQSAYMTYCIHRQNTPILPAYTNYDQYYYLCNRPVYPHRFDKQIIFPTSYRYRTEVMLLTKYLNPDDLREWLDHHLNTCKFDRIHVFDNESPYDVRSSCDEYSPRVTNELVEGQAYQYRLYDSYLESRSNAEWVIPLDDDEYLDIGEFDSIYDGVMYYRNKFPHMDMLAIRWKHLFPKSFKTERTGKVLDYCTEENPELAKKFMWLGDGTVKTIVRRYGKIHYEETWENPCGGHVPKNSVFLGALLPNGRNIQGVGIPECPYELPDERMRILHCRYKGPSDYMKKMESEVTVSDSVPRKKKWPFDEILPTLE